MEKDTKSQSVFGDPTEDGHVCNQISYDMRFWLVCRFILTQSEHTDWNNGWLCCSVYRVIMWLFMFLAEEEKGKGLVSGQSRPDSLPLSLGTTMKSSCHFSPKSPPAGRICAFYILSLSLGFLPCFVSVSFINSHMYTQKTHVWLTTLVRNFDWYNY